MRIVRWFSLPPMPDRTYTQEEVAALFERAAELQSHASRRRERQGLTLAELEHVAAEAGLDPALLRAAAEELEEPARPLAGRRSGTTATHVYTERWVPGELTAEAWEDVVSELRHRYDSEAAKMWGMGTGYGSSTVEQVGRTVEWKHLSMAGVETRVLVQPRGDQLRIRASQRVGMMGTEAESVMYGLIVTLVVGALLLPLSGAAGVFWLGIVGTLLTLLAAIPLIYRLDRGWRRKKHRELEELADHVAEALAAPPSRAGTPPLRSEAPLLAQAAPPLDLPEGEFGAPEETRARTRTRS